MKTIDSRAAPQGRGAFVISLDFELHWGVRDTASGSAAYIPNLLGARAAIPRLLDLFESSGIAATWATVGFLFAESREELEAYHPEVKPQYRDPRLDPYRQEIGRSEADDPLHYAASLIRLISRTPGQEVATHTYSHYYCLEDGSDADSFSADLASAKAIARARGVELRSIVLPRNQWNPRFASIVTHAGLECYRGNQFGWMYEPGRHGDEHAVKRMARLLDSHVPGRSWNGAGWAVLSPCNGLHNVPASCFLRPPSNRGWGDGLHTNRIRRGMSRAAAHGRVFHVWWHPHNMGVDTDGHLSRLGQLLDHYRRLRDEYGMASLTMIDAAAVARSALHHA
jgi:peptidoglycan/xylan/chitin deacetylase (PgdA/CDA1 family)